MNKQTNKQLSQRQRVLGHLLSGRSLTPIESLQNFGCYRLSSVIHKLRNNGYNIKTTMVDGKYAKYKINDLGDIKYDIEDEYHVIKNV